MFSRRGLILLSVTVLLSCGGKSLDAVTGGDSGADNGSSAGTGGAGTGDTGTGGAGTGGAATGGAGTGGAGTGATTDGGGTGGAATDGPADVSSETAGETGGGDICAAFIPGTIPTITALPGISASDFCDKYATLCTFAADGQSYSSMGDCMTSYGGTSTTNQSCRAAYLCRKKATSNNPFDCPAAAGHAICQ
jgi:hypothetical protein